MGFWDLGVRESGFGRLPPLSRVRMLTAASCFRVHCSGFKVQGFGFRVQGLGFRVESSGSWASDLGCRVHRFGFGVQG